MPYKSRYEQIKHHAEMVVHIESGGEVETRYSDNGDWNDNPHPNFDVNLDDVYHKKHVPVFEWINVYSKKKDPMSAYTHRYTSCKEAAYHGRYDSPNYLGTLKVEVK